MEQQRTFKIDLSISKRHKNALNTARNSKATVEDELQQKRGKSRKMITLTMGPHFKESDLKPSTNPENRQRSKISQVDVSEFKLSGTHEPIKNEEKVDKKSEEEQMTTSVIQN